MRFVNESLQQKSTQNWGQLTAGKFDEISTTLCSTSFVDISVIIALCEYIGFSVECVGRLSFIAKIVNVRWGIKIYIRSELDRFSPQMEHFTDNGDWRIQVTIT